MLVRDVGPLSRTEAMEMALALAHRFETDHARVSHGVAELAATIPVERLAETSPFTAERLGHMVTLTTFDWSVFAGKDTEPGSGEFPSVDRDLPTDYRCPGCGFEWSGRPKPGRAPGPDGDREDRPAC